MNSKVFIILFIILYNFQSRCQTREIGNLFELYMDNYQKNIRISQRIKEEWNLSNDFFQHTHYNANKDIRIGSANLIQQVLFIYYKKNGYIPNILELMDDGKHFDNEADDGIYANYLVGDSNDFKTDESIIDVTLDTIGISTHIFQPPVNYLPEIPKIMSPIHQSTISSNTPSIYWKIDPNADGCGVILLGNTPTLGEELQNVLWTKNYRNNNDGLFSETIPTHLQNHKEYTLLVWAYTNLKKINGIWNNGTYSMEWSKFKIDSTYDINKEFVLSQNFPNPFNTSTIIKYNLPQKGKLLIKIYDLLGGEIITLIHQEQMQGEYYILWNGKNSKGQNVTSGVYLYEAKFNNRSFSKKMLIIR